MTEVTPLADRILVEPERLKDITNTGIYIPGTVKEKPSKGTVISVGEGTSLDPMKLKIGDNIFYSKHAGTEIVIEGKSLLIMRQSEALLKF